MQLKNLSKLILEKDEDFMMDVRVRDPETKELIDISGATFTAAFNKDLDTTVGGQEMTITLKTTGLFEVSIARAIINALDVKSTYFFNVFMLLSGKQYKLVKGSFQVSARALAP